MIAVGALTFRQRLGECTVIDQLAGKTVALVDAHEIGRSVDVHALARRFEHGAHEGDRRPFAVGAGNVDHGRNAAFGVAERIEDAPDAVERQVDALGMQRQQPRENNRKAAAVSISNTVIG